MDYILAAKLRVPASPTQLVNRPRLMPAQLSPITLICAPAGYGKTVLASSWLDGLNMRCAWLSLDNHDNDTTQFMRHFVSAIQSQFPDFATQSNHLSSSSQLPAISGLTRALLNDLGQLPEPLCLVLDDLHCLHEPFLHDALAFMIERLPPQLHLILISRTTPPFSLARLRAQRQLTEIYTQDLRFSIEEVQQFCNQSMQLSLNAELVKTLETRTEGWIVGLQLAALSLNNTENKSLFIKHFAGDDRHITDFLMDEVLNQLPEELQKFLLETSLLGQFNASLCDSLRQQYNSRQLINELEKQNLFISCLDHKRGWYRYHHLFASLLKTRLEEIYPHEEIILLHQRASLWFKEHSLLNEAIQHSMIAQDYGVAAQLMEDNSSHLFSLGRITTAVTWAYQLPSAILANCPKLSMLCAWAGLVMDNLSEIDRHLHSIQQYLVNNTIEAHKKHGLLGQIALIRGCQYCLTSDIERAEASVMEALNYLSPKQVLYSGASVCLGFCYYVQGELDKAQRLFAANAHISHAKYNLMIPIFAVLGLGRCHLLRGELEAAEQVYNRALAECVAFGWQDVPVCGMLHLGLGELAYESNRLIEALLHLEKGVAMTRIGQMQFFNAWGLVLLAQTQLALQHEVSLSAMQEAELIRYSERFLIEIPPLSASLVQLWLHQHRIDHVQQWLNNAQLPVKGELVFERWAEYLVLCRYLIQQQQYPEADYLLQRLFIYGEKQQQRRLLIEVLLIKAIMQHQQHLLTKAANSLQQAIICAHDSQFLRLFAQESAVLDDLLPLISKHLAHHPLVEELLALLPKQEKITPTAIMHNHISHHLVLSKKERLVARQIITGATSQEIAEVLCVSLSTIKTHTQNIYSKLGVNKRPQAIEMLLRLNLAT